MTNIIGIIMGLFLVVMGAILFSNLPDFFSMTERSILFIFLIFITCGIVLILAIKELES